MALISRLLDKKLRLHIRKVSLIGKIFANKPHYIFYCKDISLLRVVVAKEISVNRKLLRSLEGYAKTEHLQSKLPIEDLGRMTRGLILVLQQELAILNKISIADLLFHEFDVIFLHKSRTVFFDMQFSRFRHLQEREQELDVRLFAIGMRRADIPSAKIKVYRRLAQDIRLRYKSLADSVGNSALIRRNAKELLRLFRKLQNTELYSYMHEDITFVKNQLRAIIKDPKKSKVKVLLAGLYLFTPGSFDMTLSLILIKNLTKVAMKRVRSRKSRRFRVRRRVF